MQTLNPLTVFWFCVLLLQYREAMEKATELNPLLEQVSVYVAQDCTSECVEGFIDYHFSQTANIGA